MDEDERRKYIYLRNKLNVIKGNASLLDRKLNDLNKLLVNGFKINNEIAEKSDIDDVNSSVNYARDSINNTLDIINSKI